MKYRIFKGPWNTRVAVNTEINHKVISLSEQDYANGDKTDKCIQVVSDNGCFVIKATLEQAMGFFEECAIKAVQRNKELEGE